MELLQHECGVALVHCLGQSPTNSVPLALRLATLQRHRGRQGAGMAISNLSVIKFAGDNATERLINADIEPSHIAMAHVRYATNGNSSLNAVHPFVSTNKQLALCGNFHFGKNNSNHDGQIITEEIANSLCKTDLEHALKQTLKDTNGGFVLAGITRKGYSFAARDKYGIRPAYYICTNGITAVASERYALEATFPNTDVTELIPGHALITAPDGTIKITRILPPAKPAKCPFEIIYFSSGKDAEIASKRQLLGRCLATNIKPLIAGTQQKPLLTYVPNTAIDAWKGLAQELGDSVIPTAIIKKNASQRTFINATHAREKELQSIFSLTHEAHKYKGHDIIIVDDSIVRGTTFRHGNLLTLLAQLNPAKIIIASAAPPVLFPDYYGIDIPTQAELVACKALAADQSVDASLVANLLTPPNLTIPLKVVYQTVTDLKNTLGSQYGTWVFTGKYPENT